MIPIRLRPVALLVGSLVAAAPAAATDEPRFWEDRVRGWHFYEEAPQVIPNAPPARVPDVRPARPDEVGQFERLQRSLEELRQIAIIRPTEQHVRRYMELEARIVAQASRFADVAQRVAWASPELDGTLQGRPTNAKAVEVFEREQAASRASRLANVSRDHVLIFFYRSDCPYCHAFAPTLDAFSRLHAMQVLPVSLDGGVLPAFPGSRRDNGIAAALQVTQVPAVFLAKPSSGQITPIGFGVMSEAQLLERIAATASGPIDPSVTVSEDRPTFHARQIR